MSIVALVASAAEESATGGVDPLIVGLGTFLLLLAMLVALVAFGGGRDHS